MFGRKKKEIRYLELNAEELRLMRRAVIEFRNWCLEQGKPTEDLDDILIRYLS